MLCVFLHFHHKFFAFFIFAVNVKNRFSVGFNLAKAFVFVVSDVNDGFFLVFEYLVEEINQQFFVGFLAKQSLKTKIGKGIDLSFF